MAEREDVEELYAHRDDPEEWEDEPEEFEVRQSLSQVVSFRMPPEELDELVEAADNAGETLSGYIRRAIDLRLHGPSGVVHAEASGSFHRHVHIEMMDFIDVLESVRGPADEWDEVWTEEQLRALMRRDLIA